MINSVEPEITECSFETDRLLVKEWHSLTPGDWQRRDLGAVVAGMLTEQVTRALPETWQGPYSPERARAWIRERDEEGPTTLVVDKATGNAVGMMILHVSQAPDERVGSEVRLGYLLAEGAWGKGFASELVAGFIAWCRGHTHISSIAAGVAWDNPASRRVLEKNDFSAVQTKDDGEGEQLFRLHLR